MAKHTNQGLLNSVTKNKRSESLFLSSISRTGETGKILVTNC